MQCAYCNLELTILKYYIYFKSLSLYPVCFIFNFFFVNKLRIKFLHLLLGRCVPLLGLPSVLPPTGEESGAGTYPSSWAASGRFLKKETK